jgi:hypothetical protein
MLLSHIFYCVHIMFYTDYILKLLLGGFLISWFLNCSMEPNLLVNFAIHFT